MDSIEIQRTNIYEKWYNGIRDSAVRRRISARLVSLAQGNFGDHKSVGEGVWELRLNFAGGIRIYYMKRGLTVVLLLAGGDKSTQKADIRIAKEIAKGVK